MIRFSKKTSKKLIYLSKINLEALLANNNKIEAF